MKKYKINRNKKVLSDESINSHKDFNKLLDNYQHIYNQKQANRPLYKKPGFLGFIMLVLVLTFVIVTVTNKEEQWMEANEKTKKDIKISSQPSENKLKKKEVDTVKDTSSLQFNNTSNLTNKSIAMEESVQEADLDQKYISSYTIDPTRGSILYRKNGHRIIIPSKAFVNSTGEPVKEEITLTVEEYLTEDELKNTKTPSGNNLISIIKIIGTSHNNRVFIDAQNPVLIEQITDAANEYKLYHLDNNQWKEKVSPEAFARFTIGSDNGNSLFPPFSRLVWQINYKDYLNNSYNFSKTWNSISLKDRKNTGVPELLILKTSSSTVEIPVSFARLIQEKEGNQKILSSKYYLLLSANSEKKDPGAVKREKAWNMSASGNTYFTWAASQEIKNSLNSNKVTIVCTITEFGAWAVGKSGTSKIINSIPRVINYNSTLNDRTFYKKGDQEITNEYKIKN